MAKGKGASGKGKGKLIIVAVIVLVLLGGGFFGAAFTGMVKIKGITPKSKLAKQAAPAPATAAKAEEKPADAAKPEASTPEPVAEAPKPKPVSVDLEKGAAAVAEIWNNLPNDRVLAITANWEIPDIARVFGLMETEKTAAILSMMKPDEASRISEEIQRQAGTPDPEG
ncbi:MAG: hypothetical protein JNM85_07015 [Chthonomonas sp.]|nr:hypothetical protein [Chthonomonas sp.]